jgi:TonB-dependent receptor-like protein
MQPSIAKRPESGAPSLRELHSRGSRPAIGLCVVGLTLDPVSVGAEDNRRALEEIHPTMTLPTITVKARSPTFDPAFEINSVTVLNRDTLARSEERALNGVLRGLPGVTLQSPGQRGTLSSLFVRGASAGLGQLSFDGVPLYSSVNGAFPTAKLKSAHWPFCLAAFRGACSALVSTSCPKRPWKPLPTKTFHPPYETQKIEGHWRHGGILYRGDLVRVVVDVPDSARNR